MTERLPNGRFPRGNGSGGAGHGPASGAGWGGPAKGEGSRFEPGNAGRPVGIVQGKRTVADLMAEAGAREIAAERWLAILNDPGHPKHAEMVAKAADRLDGAPVQRHEIRDADPDSMTDAELAAIASRGRGTPAGPETDQG